MTLKVNFLHYAVTCIVDTLQCCTQCTVSDAVHLVAPCTVTCSELYDRISIVGWYLTYYYFRYDHCYAKNVTIE